MEKYEFGTRVAQLRKIKGMTQTQLAEKLNVSNKTISRWETGDGYPDILLLKPLADVLGVSIDYLLDKENKEEQKELPLPVNNTVRELPFDWRHPRWNDLTPLNKVAAATLMVVIIYNISWLLLATFTRFEVINIFVMINAVLIKYLPITGIICAVIGMVRGEKGLSYRQRNVSRVLIVGNIFIPMIIFLIPLALL